MSTDIRFERDNKHFKYRVAGIVECDNKILIVKMNNNDFYCFPGGHVELMESTFDAIKRELSEELYFEVKIKKLVSVGENFFYHKIRKGSYHELCFYYLAKPVNKDFEPIDKVVKEEDKNGTVIHQFKWVKKSELESINFKPKKIIENCLNDGIKFLHFISQGD